MTYCKECGRGWSSVGEGASICEDCKQRKKEIIKYKILDGIKAIVFLLLVSLPILLMLGLVMLTWDYRTGQDTGYISAVDKMTLSGDRTIYLRRRPLDSFMTTEEDEHEYCTTADRTEVIEKAYEAMDSGKRVIVVYDEVRPFGWRKFGHCNQAPITDIKVVEEEK